jgi:hypothetical protein
MDHFGIGAAARGMFEAYVATSRQSGRTASLLDSLKDGDRVVCPTLNETTHLRRGLAERGLKVDVLVVAPHDAHRLFELGTSKGRTLFEHTWVEQFYRDALARSAVAIDGFQRELSGHGEAHRETERQARARSAWKWVG